MRRRLRHFFTIYYAGFVLGLVAIGSTTSILLEHQSRLELQHELDVASRLLHDSIRPALASGDSESLQRQCRQFAAHTGHRAVVIDQSAKVVADSHRPTGDEPPVIQEPEIRRILTGKAATPVSAGVLERKGIASVLPVSEQGAPIGVLRTTPSPTVLGGRLRQIRWRIFLSGSAVALLALAMVGGVSWRIRRPLAAMRRGAEHFARGDLQYKLDVQASDGMSGLAGALNEMARTLQQRIDTMTRQGNEQAAVLASMVEGVLAVDNRQRVISINSAAAHLMGTSFEIAKGRGLQEVIRNADLLRFVNRTLECSEPVEDDVVLRDGDERVLQARGTSLRNTLGRPIGAVVVLHDVTRVRRLETLRRDFVANVSHELKTPITSIKGFVETLLDGALHQPADAERFLRIVARQADRLDAIIEDLLSLAKIEQSVEAANIELRVMPLIDVLRSALDECASKAQQKGIDMRLQCAEPLQANVNAPLLEQAVINLLDNAIKYSEPGSQIQVEADQSDEGIAVHVHDRGCGIAAEHLDRLFERFYRVDKARSRKFGGTGLGLAIVKHIAHAHGGHVAVASVPGKGSTFSIHLPLAGALLSRPTETLAGG